MDDRARREWLMKLSKLIFPVDPPKAVAAMVEYLPYLEIIPDTAFTTGAMMAVVAYKRRMAIPDLMELVTPLKEWWDAEQLRQKWAGRPLLALPTDLVSDRPLPAPRAEPTEAEKLAVSGIVRAFTERGPMRSAEPVLPANPLGPKHPPPDALRALRQAAGIPIAGEDSGS